MIYSPRMSFIAELGPQYAARAAAAGLRPEDVTEHFILGSGHGGQRRNKRATAVQLHHHPSGAAVRCFHMRDQHQNRVAAWMQLLERLEDWKKGVEQAFKREEHAERQRTKKRPESLKREMVRGKKKRGEIKKLRKRQI